MRRLVASGAKAVLLLAMLGLSACGVDADADAGEGAASNTSLSTTTSSRPATTAPRPTTTTTTSTTSTTTTSMPVEVAPTLPALPTTTTTFLDRSSDPPQPVADPPPPPGRNSVMVIGDSVLLGTTRTIPLSMSHWVVTYDAVGSRRLAQAVDLIAMRRPEIGEAVVIHLGNNYIDGERGGYASQIEEVMGLLWFVPRVVWVTVSEVNPGRAEINMAIRDAATRWPNMRVAEWAPMIAANPQWSTDGLHLNHDGRWAMAQLVAQVVGPVDPS